MHTHSQIAGSPAESGQAARVRLETAIKEGSRDAVDIVRALITDRKASDTLRAYAALVCLDLRGPKIEQILLSVLTAQSPDLVIIHACRTLGFIGTADALKALRALKSRNELVNQAAQFAHILIAHRFGQSSPYFEPEEEKSRLSLTGAARPFTSSELTTDDTGRVCKALSRFPYLGPMRDSASVFVQCHAHRWTIALPDDVVSEGIGDAARRVPRVLAAVLRWHAEPRSWSLSRIVLGGPLSRNRSYVAVFRRDGTLDLFGTSASNEPMVQLHSVTRSGAIPLLLNAHWHGNRLSIAGLSAERRTAKNVTPSIDPPVVRPLPKASAAIARRPAKTKRR